MRGRPPTLSSQRRHVDGSPSPRRSYDSCDWAWGCEHAASEDFRRALGLLQPHLNIPVSQGKCCSLRPPEVYIKSYCSSKVHGDAAAVRIWLGAGGASLFRLQIQTVTGVTVAPSRVDEPLFELSMPSGAVIHLRGMANYGVASYCAALGDLLLQGQQHGQQGQQAGPPASAAATSRTQRSGPCCTTPVPAPSAAAARRNRSHTYSRSHPTRSGGGCGAGGGGAKGSGLAKGPLSVLSTSAGGARLAGSICSVASREGILSSGGRRGAAAKAAAAAAGTRGHVTNWLRAAEVSDSSGGVAAAAAEALLYGGGDDVGDDDLRSDVDFGGGDVGGGCNGSAGGARAACPGPVVRVTAWVRVGATGSELHLPYDECRTSTSVAPEAAALEFDNSQGTAATVAAVDDRDDDDVASDADAGGGGGASASSGDGSRIIISMRWTPDAAAPRRNAHLLDLLGLPPAACSYRIPVPEPETDAEPLVEGLDGGPLLVDAEECVSVLGLLGGEERLAEPGWEGDGGWCGYELLSPTASPSGKPTAAAAAAGLMKIGSCPAAVAGEGSYSLEGSGLDAQGVRTATTTAAVTSAPGRELMVEARRLHQQQRQQLGRGRSLVPAAVEVLNLTSALGHSTAVAGAGPADSTAFAVSYINSLDWYGDDEELAVAAYGDGGGAAVGVQDFGGLPLSGTDLLYTLYGDNDDIIELEELPYGDGAATAAASAAATAIADGACGFHWRGGAATAAEVGGTGGGCDASPPDMPRWFSPDGSRAPPIPPPVLLTSLTAGAMWL